MEVVKEQAQDLLEAIGYDNATSWKENSKIKRFLNKLDTLEKAEQKLEDTKLEKLRKSILKALSNEDEITLVSSNADSEEKPEKVAKAKAKATKAKDDGEGSDEEDTKEAAESNGKAKKDKKPSPERGKRTEVFGHSITTVARWMGHDRWTKEEALKAFEELGVSDGIAVTTLQTCLSYGKKGDEQFGKIAVLDEPTQNKLRRAAGKKTKRAPKEEEVSTKATKPKSGKIQVDEDEDE